MSAAPPDLLAAIVACARRIVEVRRAAEPMAALERRAEAAAPRGDAFVEALSRADRLNVIAECKRRSPSRGVLCERYEPAVIAGAYASAGAAAVSVLTEPAFFDGCLSHLRAVRERVEIPVLRKDFIVDEYQLLEARAAGADAVLLIVAALGGEGVQRLAKRAAGLGLAALVEAHDRDEVRVAADAGARVIGINNRNLRTLAVDPDASLRLADAIPRGTIAVAESGLRAAADLRRLRGEGYDAFLVGERLVTAPDPGAALRELVAGGAE